MIFDNSKILNIFCDASIKNSKRFDATIGCAGATAVVSTGIPGEFYIKDTETRLLFKTTNNIAELNAIDLAVSMAYKYGQDFKVINIFSDSQVSVNSLRTWIFWWMESAKNGVLYSTSGVVANQEIILRIVTRIVRFNRCINILHQKGHVKTSDESLDNAYEVFFKSNPQVDPNVITYNDIKIASNYNNFIDAHTRNIVNAVEVGNYNEDAILVTQTKSNFDLVNNTIGDYKGLINSDGGMVYNK